MPKHAISVTLDTANLTWLKARVRVEGLRSVSALLDRIVAVARRHQASGSGRRSVAGTIDIGAAAPGLLDADAALRSWFDASVVGEGIERQLRALVERSGRPMTSVVREAVELYVVEHCADSRSRLGFIAAGRSGHRDTAEGHEDLLFEEPSAGKAGNTPGGATTRARHPRAPRRQTRSRR